MNINALEIHSSGVLRVPINDGQSIVMTPVQTGKALYFLSYPVDFYEHLRVRDLFKMIVKYPELQIVVPGLADLSAKYKCLPKIGCASPEVVSVWLCWSTLYAYDGVESLSDKAVFFASEGDDMEMVELSTFDLGLERWLDCPIKQGMDSVMVSEVGKPPLSLIFNASYTLFDALRGLGSTFVK